jgi:hypothetical protein
MTELERKLFESRLERLETDQPLLHALGALMIFLLAVVALGLIVIFYISHPPLPATLAAGAAVGVGIPLFLLGRRHARRRR